MAKGKKTGGRDFKKGNGGRKKGAKDKVPRGLKAKIVGSIREMYEALLTGEPELFEKRIRRDLQRGGGSVGFQHVQLAAHYLDGKPVETVNVRPDLSQLTTEEIALWEQLMSKAHRKPNEPTPGGTPA